MVQYIICSNQPFHPSLAQTKYDQLVSFRFVYEFSLKFSDFIISTIYYGVNVNPKKNYIKNLSDNYHSNCRQYNDSLLMMTNICSLPQPSPVHIPANVVGRTDSSTSLLLIVLTQKQLNKWGFFFYEKKRALYKACLP